MRHILFLCTGNSARSQMAESVLRQLAGDQFNVISAGTSPEPIHPLTLDTLKKNGYATEGLQSKSLSAVPDRHFDFIISLCDKAQQECSLFPNASDIIAWHIPDPKQRCSETSFQTALKDIVDRINMFLLVQNRQPHTFDRIKFFKALAEPHRLTTLFLIAKQSELCVCELIPALQEPQPKVSRYLAELKKAQLVAERRQGQWLYYRLSPSIPTWAKAVIDSSCEGNEEWLQPALERLQAATEQGETSAAICAQ